MSFGNVVALTMYVGLLAIEVDDLRKPDCRYFRQSNDEAYRSADVVLSGTVLQINVVPWARVLRAVVRVRRLWKGEWALPKRQPYTDIVVEHFRDKRFCSDRITVKDTKIFFLRKTGATTFLLNSTVVPISLEAIDSLDSIRLGLKNYTAKEIDKTGCERIRCDFKASCQINEGDDSPECVCRFQCENITKPVCGTDHSTYSNECELYAAQCARQTRIGVLYRQACETVSPCHSVNCLYGSHCKENVETKTAQCVCPENCPAREANATVCGEDGLDYSSICEMDKRSCDLQRPIKLKMMGQCNPCTNVTCPEYTVCKVGWDRMPRCRCSDRCSMELKPVCASNNKTYRNACFMNIESCRLYQELSVLYEGFCQPNYGPCKKLHCAFGQTCGKAIDGRYSCLCQFNCQPIFNPVCGKGGVTYDNECQLLKAACEEKSSGSFQYDGLCLVSKCARKQCPNGGKCVLTNGEAICICPPCNYVYDPVCASNRLTYENECEMRRHACLSQEELFVLYRGICGGCENTICDYYAQCVSQPTGHAECRCPSLDDCKMDNVTVCGTDGITYPNMCALKLTACKKRAFVMVASKGSCDYCRGKRCDRRDNCSDDSCSCPSHCARPILKEVVCASDGHLYASICYMRKAACRKAISLQAIPLERCNRSSPVVAESKIPCHCNRLGSLNEVCDKNGKCNCRSHVIGQQCDQCESGFWGFRLNTGSSVGCIPCNCSSMGSLRNDCEQTSGRCVCKPGVVGLKCEKCLIETESLGSNGCQSLPTKLLANYKASHAMSAALKSSPHANSLEKASVLLSNFFNSLDDPSLKERLRRMQDHPTIAAGYSPRRMKQQSQKTATAVTFCLLIPVAPSKFSQVAEFRGNGYVAVPDVHTDDSQSFQKFNLHFCPRHHDAIILHTVSVNQSGQYDGGDFFSLILIDGRLFVQFNLGAGVSRIGPSWKIAMNKWQRVIVQRNLSSVTLSMNGRSQTVNSPAGLNRLNIHPNVVYFGGVPNDTIVPLAAPLYLGFRGFIHEAVSDANRTIDLLNSKNILHKVRKIDYPICGANKCITNCRCVPANISLSQNFSDGCSPERTGASIRLDNKFGGIYHSFSKPAKIDCRPHHFSFSLNTTFLDGTVLVEQLGEGNSDHFVLIRLLNGLPTVFVKSGDNTRPLMQSGIFVADGLWHNITLFRVNEEMELTIDGQATINRVVRLSDNGLCQSGRLLIGAFHGLVGGSTVGLSNVLNGCLSNLQIQGVPVDFVMDSIESIGVPAAC
ncbi:agrin [Trichuris trichiura]|uniref:Agrin n=1 Tax=Trichuris trichiura TaxID=36087 RepID=A0A077Z0H1_TRITR|nr:agrin [Trichuris trichiura]